MYLMRNPIDLYRGAFSSFHKERNRLYSVIIYAGRRYIYENSILVIHIDVTPNVSQIDVARDTLIDSECYYLVIF